MRKKLLIPVIIIFSIILGAAIFGILLKEPEKVKVYMKGESGRIGERVVVDLKVSDIPDEYQASSFVIDFNHQKLKLIAIEKGNIATVGKDSSIEQYPDWQFDADAANSSGKVSVMYLDMTAGDQPLSKRGFEKGKKDVLFRMEFEVLSTCGENEKLKLGISQATFASVDEKLSLALQKRNILVESYQIAVIE